MRNPQIAKSLKQAFELGRPELAADLIRQKLAVLTLRVETGMDFFEAVGKFQVELGMDEFPVFESAPAKKAAA